MKISEVDKNFKIETSIKRNGLIFLDAKEAPFAIYGVFHEDGFFRRMPKNIAKTVSDGVYYLHSNCAGGRIRFKTNSPYVAIHAKMSEIGKMPHFTLCGSGGFDLYEKQKYIGTFMPPYDMTDGYESIIELGSSKMRELTINLPTYSNVQEVYIGVSKRAKIEAPTPYKIDKPIVYYGSSITQGGCVSRPGNTYQAMLSRELDVDHINLGFSGNARAEREISEYIKSLDMSVFVYDYDHNAPTIEHLEATHERMFKEIREKHPTLPIIMMSRPKYILNKNEKIRLEIIKRTYQNAISAGDKNVYLIDGVSLMRYAKTEGTVDNCHPNDLGFYSMAKVMKPIMKKLLVEIK